jgi:hypothetical protein
MTNASVLPDPVAASTATSLCPQNSGSVASCTGVAVAKPRASSTASVRLLMHLSWEKGVSGEEEDCCAGAAAAAIAAVVASGAYAERQRVCMCV